MLDLPLKDLVLNTPVEGLHLIPSNKNLVGATLELADRPDREKTLRKKMESFRNEFNYILLDCPPALDLAHPQCPRGGGFRYRPRPVRVFRPGRSFRTHRHPDPHSTRSHNRNLAVEGILLTMFDERTNLAHQVRDDLRDFFGDQVFSTVIPRNVRLAEAPSFGQPIFLYDPDCKGATSYLELAKEVMSHAEKGVGPGAERSSADG